MNDQDHRAYKHLLFEQFARITKALASPKRLELVDLLAQGERSVEELAREAGMSVANTSQHLQTLRSAHLVEVRRDGLYAYYRLASPTVFTLWRTVREMGEAHLAEIDRVVRAYRRDLDALDGLSLDQLQSRLERGEVVLLDVRPEAEYRAGHLPGARSIPIDELAERLAGLPKDREVVAYCRGRYCVFADEAVAVLRAHGYRAARLSEGFPDWQAAGMPVER